MKNSIEEKLATEETLLAYSKIAMAMNKVNPILESMITDCNLLLAKDCILAKDDIAESTFKKALNFITYVVTGAVSTVTSLLSVNAWLTGTFTCKLNAAAISKALATLGCGAGMLGGIFVIGGIAAIGVTGAYKTLRELDKARLSKLEDKVRRDVEGLKSILKSLLDFDMIEAKTAIDISIIDTKAFTLTELIFNVKEDEVCNLTALKDINAKAITIGGLLFPVFDANLLSDDKEQLLHELRVDKQLYDSPLDFLITVKRNERLSLLNKIKETQRGRNIT